MAITKTIEIDVNSQGATSGINNITNSIEGADKATQSLKSQLRQAQADVAELSNKFGDTSKQAIEAAKRAAELKDAIGDAKTLTDAFNPDAKFSALSGSLSGVASGFSAVEGSLALAGIQSENLQETMVRLQAAMALSQGLQGLGESINSFKQMGAVAKNALAGIKTGIAATGIGILLVAVGAIAVYWDDIKEAVNGVSSEQESLNKLAEKNLTTEQGKLDAVSSQDNVLKLQGKSEKEILKIKLAQTDQVIKASEIQIQQSIATTKAQTEAAKRNQDILAGVLKFLSLPLTMILKTVDAVGSALGKDFGLEDKVFKGLSSFVFDPKETQAEGDKVVAEQKKALEKLKNDRAGLQLSINNIDKQASNDAASKRKEANDKAKDDAQKAKDKAIELEKEKADALERIRQGQIDTEAERRAEELYQIQEQYRLLIAEAEKYGQDTTALKEAQRVKEKEITDKFAAEDAEKKLAEDEKAKAEAQKKLDEEKVIADEKIKIEQAVTDAKLALQNQALDTASQGIGLLKGLFEKNKGLQKAALIAESAIGISKIVINTQAANAAARLKYALLPGGAALAATEIVLNKISAGIGIAGNIAATSKALGALGGGGSAGGGGAIAGGGGGGAGSPPPAPQFNVVGNSGINQVAATLGQQQPVQAFVVANQVTTQQSLDRNIINNASIG
jgi:membrane protein involved in colicin uptake